MKGYPSIFKDYDKSLSYYVFQKFDGSQIRSEWSKKNGFYKFGTRNVLLEESDSNNIFSKACPMIRENYSKDISDIFKELKIERAVLFFEYFGPQSFAGNHVEGDAMEVILFDIDVYKQGIMMPNEFVKNFGHLKVPKVLHHGKVGGKIIEEIKNSTLPGITFEGVVCKANNPKKTKMPIMFKVKTDAWLNKLHNFCGEDLELYRKLE